MSTKTQTSEDADDDKLLIPNMPQSIRRMSHVHTQHFVVHVHYCHRVHYVIASCMAGWNDRFTD